MTVKERFFKVCLHVSSPLPCPSKVTVKVSTLCWWLDTLTGKTSCTPILSNICQKDQSFRLQKRLHWRYVQTKPNFPLWLLSIFTIDDGKHQRIFAFACALYASAFLSVWTTPNMSLGGDYMVRLARSIHNQITYKRRINRLNHKYTVSMTTVKIKIVSLLSNLGNNSMDIINARCWGFHGNKECFGISMKLKWRYCKLIISAYLSRQGPCVQR